jgi:hypothetical protein
VRSAEDVCLGVLPFPYLGDRSDGLFDLERRSGRFIDVGAKVDVSKFGHGILQFSQDDLDAIGLNNMHGTTLHLSTISL